MDVSICALVATTAYALTYTFPIWLCRHHPGMRGAPAAARRDLRNRLLVQFSELGLRAGSSHPSHDSIRAEMGRLLPAIAEAGEGLEAAPYGASASRFSMGSLVAQQQMNGTGSSRADLQMIRVRTEQFGLRVTGRRA